MAVGRITGPLLAKNLTRDGIDLSFETDLLYLDVKNGRIGVKTTSPQYTLDVNDSLRALRLTVNTTSTLGLLTLSSSSNTSSIVAQYGDIAIQAGASSTILLNSDVSILGNTTLQNNLTVSNNVELGNSTSTISLYGQVNTDIIPETSSTYDIGKIDKSFADVYVENLLAKQISSFPGTDVNITPSLGNITNINSDVRIWGQNPLGTSVVTSNVLYVNMDGSDTNDGRAQDATRACRTITGALRSPYYKAGTSIKVAPGHYLENNPLELKPYTSIIGSDLRTTSIEPINKTQDLFHLQSGCYLAQMLFINGRSGLLPGIGYNSSSNRGAYATAFPPNYGKTPIDVYHSPYVQNCTNQSGPWLADGTMFVPNQTVQIPQAVGTSTWIANTTTLVVKVSEGAISIGQTINAGPTHPDYFDARTLLLANKGFIQEQIIAYTDQNNIEFSYNTATCHRDTGLIVDAIGMDMLYDSTSDSVFSGLQYWNQDVGFTGSIPSEITATIAAISYLKDIAKTYVSPGSQTTLDTLFGKINTILTIGPAGITDTVIYGRLPTTSTTILSDASTLESNKGTMQSEVINYITSNFPTLTYNSTTCARDVGYIIDAVTFDLRNGGNVQSIKSGIYYYGYDAASTAIPNEIPQTTDAYNFIKSIIPSIITGQLITTPYQYVVDQATNLTTSTTATAAVLTSNIDVILNIVTNGPTVYNDSYKSPQNLTESSDQDVINAWSMLHANRAYIQAETIAYINQTNAFNYNRAKCFRDVGIIVENIAYDIAFGGNQKTVESGLAYWDGVTSVISGELTTTTNAINYIDTLAQEVITNTTATDLLNGGGKYPQVINTTLAGGAVASSQITKSINTITYIINNGPSVAPTIQIGNGPDWGSVSAEVLLQANRTYLQNEIIDWIDYNYPDLFYREDKCYRDVGLIIDAITQDVILNGNAKSIEAAVTYWTGNVIAIKGQVTETVAAINHLKDVALQIINNTTATGTTAFTFNSVKCRRDIGLIVDGLAQDLLFDGNSQSAFAGVQYWNHDNLVGNIASEITTTTAAINYMSTLAQQIVQNITGGTRYQSTITQSTAFPSATGVEAGLVSTDFAVITNILTNGVTGVTDSIVPNSIYPNTSTDIINALSLLESNREYIKQEVISFIEQTKTLGFTYNSTKCARDVGYILDSIEFDLLYGGNRQAIQSGVYYWGYSASSTSLPKERVASTLAYQYMKEVITNVITSTPLLSTYQNTSTQVLSTMSGTIVESDAVATNIDLITTIINAGPKFAPAPRPISLVASNNRFVNNAVELLHDNRAFIQAEVAAYVEQVQVNNQQIILPYYDHGSYATPAITRSFDIITNILNNGIEVAPIKTQGQGIFVSTGLSLDDVKDPAIVTAVTDLGSGTYQIDLSQSTVGFGDNQCLYFGETAVYPLLENDVPERWAQRRIDPIGSMGGSLVDGGVVSRRSPITSFVYDAFTQVNQGGVGIHITNNGYAQLVSVFTIFCSKAVIAENGGICSITNSNSNFGDLCLISKGHGRREFSGYVYNPPVAPYFPNGVYPQGGQVEIYIADPALRPHIALVMEVIPANTYTNVVGFPGFLTGNANTGTITKGDIVINGIDTTGMVVGQKIYIRDQYGNIGNNNSPYITTGTIIADINYQSITLNYPINASGGDPNNSNFFNVYSCGNAYYTVLSSAVGADPITPGTFLLPGTQGSEESGAISYLSSLAQDIIQNNIVTPLQTGTVQVIDPSLLGGVGAGSFIISDLSLITSIITNGPGSAPTVVKYATPPTGAGSAASLLNKNKNFITAEVIAYVDTTYPPFTYNTATCSRDTGLIIDSITEDLLFSTSSQSTFAGIQYWSQSSYVGAISTELTTTTNAINYVSTLTQQIILNSTGTRYQSTVSQVSVTPASAVEVAKVSNEFGIITHILSSGTAGITDTIVPNGITASSNTNTVNAYNSIQSNRDYIIAEAIAYVQATKTLGFTYDANTCRRDVGFMLDSISFDLLYGGNRQAVQSGVSYYGYTTSTQVPNEITQVIKAYNFINTLSQKLILGQSITAYQTAVAPVTGLTTATITQVNNISSSLNTITNIIQNGPSVASPLRPISLTRSTDANIINAATILHANREFIQAETIAYINKIYAAYNKNKCARDVGLLVDALVYDLEDGGNYNAITAGKSYYATTGTHHIVTLEESVTDTGLFPDGAIVNFYQRSYMSASGYLFEYVGAGSNYGSLPQVGRADPVQTKEVVQINNGKVFFTSTDQNGDFRIGPGLVISQATGVLSGRTFTKSLFANLTPFILAIEGI